MRRKCLFFFFVHSGTFLRVTEALRHTGLHRHEPECPRIFGHSNYHSFIQNVFIEGLLLLPRFQSAVVEKKSPEIEI